MKIQHSNRSREGACDGKQRHTAESARLVARKSRHSGMHAYRCGYCGHWHVGGDGNGVRRAIRRRLQESVEAEL